MRDSFYIIRVHEDLGQHMKQGNKVEMKTFTTSPVTIENLPDRDFTLEQVPTSSQQLLCFLM
jgi:hypothetical protein